MELLGKGGFASVYKVLNELDRNEYAIKKIQIKMNKTIKEKFEQEFTRVTREARYLAQINHPNIIRYYNSWIELNYKKKFLQKTQMSMPNVPPSFNTPTIKKQQDQKIKENNKDKDNLQKYGRQSSQMKIKQEEEEKTSRSFKEGDSEQMVFQDSKFVLVFENGSDEEQQSSEKLTYQSCQEDEESKYQDESEASDKHQNTKKNDHTSSVSQSEEASQKNNNQGSKNNGTQKSKDESRSASSSPSSRCKASYSENKSSKIVYDQNSSIGIVFQDSAGNSIKSNSQQESQKLVPTVKQESSQKKKQGVTQDLRASINRGRSQSNNLNELNKINKNKANKNYAMIDQSPNQHQNIQNGKKAQVVVDTSKNFILAGAQRKNNSVDIQDSSDEEERIDEIIFFIQLQLCKETLDDYIKRRNSELSKYKQETQRFQAFEQGYLAETQEILTQIIKGVQYIHQSMSLVHRDLKPHNIFLTENKDVQIGDFGLVQYLNSLLQKNNLFQTPEQQLATGQIPFLSPQGLTSKNPLYSQVMDLPPLPGLLRTPSTDSKKDQSSENQSSEIPSYKNRPSIPYHLPMSIGKQKIHNDELFADDDVTYGKCGTKNYASPEQLDDQIKGFDHRADIYSLGVIMLQMFVPMFTQMEFIDSLSKLKSGRGLPALVRYPEVEKTLIACLSLQPQKRPKLSEIARVIDQFFIAKEVQQFGYMEFRTDNNNAHEWQQKQKKRIKNTLTIFSCNLAFKLQRYLKLMKNQLFCFNHPLDQKAQMLYNLEECVVGMDVDNKNLISLDHPYVFGCFIKGSSEEQAQKVYRQLSGCSQGEDEINDEEFRVHQNYENSEQNSITVQN